MRGSEQVQVQLRLPLTSEPREQRCSSSTAHESLRRFAEGYVFGSATRIGNSQPAETQDTPVPSSAIFPCNDPTDFASRAVKSEEDKREKPTRRRRPDGKRSALVFGDNAPKVTLPVKERIERKTAPKRCRDAVSVDMLSAMMEELFSGSSGGVNGSRSNVEGDELARTIGDMKLRRKPCERFGKSKCLKNVKVARTEVVEKENENDKRVVDEIAKLEDDDTADELSFLVNRCDLDSDKARGPFMPYIT